MTALKGTLGLSAALIPFLEHNDPPRILMGANMMRQWLSPSAPETAPVSCPNGMSRVAASPEPALVQTGYDLMSRLLVWTQFIDRFYLLGWRNL